MSPLLPGSLPAKTSFGTDGKKQLSFPTNDLQKMFLSSLRTQAEIFFIRSERRPESEEATVTNLWSDLDKTVGQEGVEEIARIPPQAKAISQP